MGNYRVILKNKTYYVQKKIGIFFRHWEDLNIYGITLDYDHDWEDAESATFANKEDAIAFMEKSASPLKIKKEIKIVAWIGDSE